MATVATNVLVRFLIGDDVEQYKKARSVFEQQAIFIPDTVLLETEWILRYAYGFGPEQICTALLKVGGLPKVTLQNPLQIHQALTWHRDGLDFADALHLAHSEGHEPFYTFDRKLVKLSAACGGAAVREP